MEIMFFTVLGPCSTELHPLGAATLNFLIFHEPGLQLAIFGGETCERGNSGLLLVITTKRVAGPGPGQIACARLVKKYPE